MKTLLCSLATAALLSVNLSTSAQFFTAPAAHNDVYPSATPILLRPETSSAYSIENVGSPYGPAALYLAGWSGRGSTGAGFSWRFTDPSDPSIIYGQDSVDYSGKRDIEVGLVDDPSGPVILVAYYEMGPAPGHKLDVYRILPGVSYWYTVNLSSATKYGRISMDCHLTYGVAIVWDNPDNNAIEAMGGNVGGWGPVVSLPPHPTGASSSDPDVAFSHSSGPLNVHFVTYTAGAGELTESVVGWPDLMAGSLGSYMVEDNNPISATPFVPIRPVIDCPDHYDVENWAYTYTTNEKDIEVRLVDYHTGGFPYTRIINDGSLANLPSNSSYYNKMPSLAHDPTGKEIYVGWYVNNSFDNRYIALNMTEDGWTRISNQDYMGLPNSNTPSAYPLTPGFSLSKMADLNWNFLYGVYYTLSGNAGYELHHAWHKWPNLMFKGESGNPRLTYHPECGTQKTTMVSLASRVHMNASPNPFTDVVTAAVVTDKSGMLTLQLTDLTGKVIDHKEYAVEKGNYSLSTGSLKNLAAGMYLLNVSLDGTRIGQQKLIKQ